MSKSNSLNKLKKPDGGADGGNIFTRIAEVITGFFRGISG